MLEQIALGLFIASLIVIPLVLVVMRGEGDFDKED